MAGKKKSEYEPLHATIESLLREGVSVIQIAKRLGCAENTVRAVKKTMAKKIEVPLQSSKPAVVPPVTQAVHPVSKTAPSRKSDYHNGQKVQHPLGVGTISRIHVDGTLELLYANNKLLADNVDPADVTAL